MNHVRNLHSQLQQNYNNHKPVNFTLLVGDSHLNSVNRRQLERGLGRGARLVTPGATRPGEDRAYCSSADWPGIRFKENTLVQMVPELLGERMYSKMIMMAPTNDISNLVSISSQEEREHLAILSARNTIYVAEQALKKSNYLQEVLIMEQPARVDNLAGMSNLSTTKLRELALTSLLAGRIRIGSNQSELCTTDEQKAAIFDAPSSHKADGVHMRGEDGKKFLTKTFVEAAKYSGMADKDTRLGGERPSAGGLEGQEHSWARVVSGPNPTTEMDGQEPNWARAARGPSPTTEMDGQKHNWARVVRGPSPTAEMDGQQQQGRGELSNNRYFTLGN